MTKQCKSGSTALFSKSSEDSPALWSLVLNFYFAIQCVNYDLDTKWTCKHQINLQMPTKYTLLLIPSKLAKLKSYIQVLETILRQRCHEHRSITKIIYCSKWTDHLHVIQTACNTVWQTNTLCYLCYYPSNSVTTARHHLRYFYLAFLYKNTNAS